MCDALLRVVKVGERRRRRLQGVFLTSEVGSDIASLRAVEGTHSSPNWKLLLLLGAAISTLALVGDEAGGLTPAHRGQEPAAGRPGHTTYKVGDVAS